MKQSTIFSRILMLGLILMLVLAACEKQTDGAKDQEATLTAEAANPATAVPATPIPTAVPEEATAVPETVIDPATEAPVAETPESGTPADGNPTPVPGAVGGDPATDPQAGGGEGTSANPAPVPAGGTYTVSAGENFFRIGLNHGCSVGQMAAVNPHVAPPYYTIYVGQVLTIPSCP